MLAGSNPESKSDEESEEESDEESQYHPYNWSEQWSSVRIKDEVWDNIWSRHGRWAFAAAGFRFTAKLACDGKVMRQSWRAKEGCGALQYTTQAYISGSESESDG